MIIQGFHTQNLLFFHEMLSDVDYVLDVLESCFLVDFQILQGWLPSLTMSRTFSM